MGADDTQLEFKALDPKMNWYVISFVPENTLRRLLIIPDPFFLRDLGYPESLVAQSAWAKVDQGMKALPNRVDPGASVEGDILFQSATPPDALRQGGDDPDAHWYLFFGNWLAARAWRRIDLGTLPDLYNNLADMMGNDPPMPSMSLEPGSAGGPPPGTRGIPSWAQPVHPLHGHHVVGDGHGPPDVQEGVVVPLVPVVAGHVRPGEGGGESS